MSWPTRRTPDPPSSRLPPQWSGAPDASQSKVATSYDEACRCQGPPFSHTPPRLLTRRREVSVPYRSTIACDNPAHRHWTGTPQSLIMPDLPSDTGTFLFTGIEGSTERWERDRAARAATGGIRGMTARDAGYPCPPFTHAASALGSPSGRQVAHRAVSARLLRLPVSRPERRCRAGETTCQAPATAIRAAPAPAPPGSSVAR
jgi:hypothetical protein